MITPSSSSVVEFGIKQSEIIRITRIKRVIMGKIRRYFGRD